MATLSFERGTGFIGDQLDLYERVRRAIGLAKRVRFEDGRLAIDHDDIAERLASLKADTMAIRAMTLASIAETDRTGVPGPKGSLMKLMVPVKSANRVPSTCGPVFPIRPNDLVRGFRGVIRPRAETMRSSARRRRLAAGLPRAR
jgi:hypothetical protein